MTEFNGKKIFLMGLKISDSSGDPQPVLNAPILSLDVNGYINITDYLNGNFTDEYLVYINGSYVATTTERQIAMSTYNIGTSDAVTVVAKGSLFESSSQSNSVKYTDVANGTIGLVYALSSDGETMAWTGLGSCTETDITVASIADGKVVSTMSGALYDNTTKMTVRLPDSITSVSGKAMYKAGNKTVVFGANLESIGATALWSGGFSTVILDFSRATKVPVLAGDQWPGGNGEYFPTTIVPDNLYDEWILATNWSKSASRIIRKSDHDAQQGASV